MMRSEIGVVALLTVGCATTAVRPVSQSVSLMLYPKINPCTQAMVQPLSLSNIATLDVVPYLLVSSGSYSPISSITGNAVSISDPNVLKLSQSSPSIDPSRPFILRNLKPNNTYRIFGKAYDAGAALISLDSSSYTDVPLTINDAPMMANLPINLLNTPFAATTAVTINTDGRYDYLKGILSLVSNGSQVGISQTSRYPATLNLGSLQGNTTYRLEVDAYKLGGIVASASQNIVIGNDNAPASQSMSLSVPYVVTTLAGQAGVHGSANGIGTAATFYQPEKVAVDANGNVYVADFNNQLIRKITTDGVVSTLAGQAGVQGSANGAGTAATFYGPRGVAVDGSGNVYVAEFNNQLIRKITSGGVVSTLAGQVGVQGSANGTGTAATFSGLCAITVDAGGTLYVADNGNHLIRKITSDGVVSTLAGQAGVSGNADGAGTAATFTFPRGIAVDVSGNVYLADDGPNLIRKVTSAGVVSTLAGQAGVGGHADGTGTAATFNYPTGVAADGTGNVYVADYCNCLIRKISSGGVVSTLAGQALIGGAANGTGTAATFNQPCGIAVDGNGLLYVSENGGHLIRVVR